MSETGLPPGPWEHDGTTVYRLTDDGKQNRFWISVQSAGWGRVAKGESSREEIEAIVRAVAALPELVEALKAFVAEHDDVTDMLAQKKFAGSPGFDCGCPRCASARAALEKAGIK